VAQPGPGADRGSEAGPGAGASSARAQTGGARRDRRRERGAPPAGGSYDRSPMAMESTALEEQLEEIRAQLDWVRDYL